MIGWLLWTAIAIFVGRSWLKVAMLDSDGETDPAIQVRQLRHRLSRAIILTLFVLGLFLLGKLIAASGVPLDNDPPGLF